MEQQLPLLVRKLARQIVAGSLELALEGLRVAGNPADGDPGIDDCASSDAASVAKSSADIGELQVAGEETEGVKRGDVNFTTPSRHTNRGRDVERTGSSSSGAAR